MGTTIQHDCDFDISAMQSAQLDTLPFQALWSSGSENHINYISTCHEKKLKIKYVLSQ